MTEDGADDPAMRPLLEVSGRIRRREVTSAAATQAMLDRIAAHNGRLHAYLHVLPERAMEQAERADAEIAAGRWRGPLHGVPLGIKDLCETSFAPTTGGMPWRRGHVPERDATVAAIHVAPGAQIDAKDLLIELE